MKSNRFETGLEISSGNKPFKGKTRQIEKALRLFL